MSTQHSPLSFAQRTAGVSLALVMSVLAAGNTLAGTREQAKRIHDRLVGTPPSAACLDQLETKVIANDAAGAAMDAITNDGGTDACIGADFYRVTLKNFITPWTNEEQTVFAPLNDYTATVIGIIRDDDDFRKILYDDVLYTGPGNPSAAVLTTGNSHYKALEDSGADLQAVLTRTTQSAATGLAAPAGVLTSRAAAKAFFVDGTNRAMFRFTMLNHLCKDMEQVKDPSYPPDRIRQDVSRSPGGDSRIFMNACVGCHSGMDPMTQAFAYYDYSYPLDGNGDPNYDAGQLVYTPGSVQPKYLQNSSNFEYGFVTPNDNWDNYWRTGSNSALGWDGALPGSGSGAASMGQELAHSDAFARCQVEKVFKAVCLRGPVDQSDRDQINTMINTFQGNGHKLKQVFADSAAFCKGN
ncbi:MAG TPA: hypothetical protein ENI97_09095 [Gammaproteobacteria bacterium]|nr:hypothetical protein [Gammaproteobacteria bacterium]